MVSIASGLWTRQFSLRLFLVTPCVALKPCDFIAFSHCLMQAAPAIAAGEKLADMMKQELSTSLGA